MMMDEDLSRNHFFNVLKRAYAPIYERAQKEGFIICVPQSRSLIGLQITKSLIETHVLQHSPYFQQQFTSLTSKEFRMDKNALIPLINHQKEGPSIKILFEEDYFNRDSKVKVLCLERPLFGSSSPSPISSSTPSPRGSFIIPSSSTSFSSSSSLMGGSMQNIQSQSNAELLADLQFPPPTNPALIRSFLLGFDENILVVRKTDQSIAALKETLKTHPAQSIEHLAQEVKKIVDSLNLNLLLTNKTFRVLHDTDRCLREFEQTVECYVLDSLHDQLFSLLRLSHDFPAEDNYYHRLREVARNVTQTDLGIRPELQDLMLEAIAQFDLLPKMTSPIAKLVCIGETLDKVTTSLGEKYSRLDETLTTDDMIPLLVYILSHSQVPALRTTQEYIQTFVFNETVRNQLSYYLATFLATLEFLKTPEFSSLAQNAGQYVPTHPSLLNAMFAPNNNQRSVPRTLLRVNSVGSLPLPDPRSMSPLSVSEEGIGTGGNGHYYSPPTTTSPEPPLLRSSRRDSFSKKSMSLARSLMGDSNPPSSAPTSRAMKSPRGSNLKVQS